MSADLPPLAILAGGLATRLRPLTETVPKAMLEIAGKPFLEHQIESVRKRGIRKIVLCVGFLGEMIEERFRDGSRYGVEIQYSYDGPTLLGTGGAIRKALPLLRDEFFLIYGDSYLQTDFGRVAEAFAHSSRSALMTVFRNENKWDSSNVHFAGGKILAYDKTKRSPEMQYIDYGLTMCRASALAGYPKAFDLSDVLKTLAARGDLAGYEVTERFYEIGSREGLSELDHMLRNAMLLKASSGEVSPTI